MKELQDFIIHSRTKYFGKLLAKLVGIDTLPITIISKDGPLKLMGFHDHKANGKEECFFTRFFRIEEIDRDECCVNVSLLLPLDISGHFTDNLCDVISLRRTATCVTINFDCICAVQCLDAELLKRKIIIEPKW